MPNVFDAQVKAVAAMGPIRNMIKGMREIIEAARGVSKSTAEGAKSAAHAGGEASHAVKHAAEGVVAAGKKAEAAIHGVEKTEEHGEATHIRYFRSIGAHVRLMHGHFGELNESIGEVGGSLKELLPAFAALGAGGTLVGMFEMTHEAAEQAIALDAAAQQIGVTANQYAGLTFAAKESGLAGDTMVRSIERLNRTMGDAGAGKNKDALALFKHLGINMKDAHGHMRGVMDVLPQLTDAFRATKDPTMQARMAFALFGRAGQELLPILLKGREGIEEMVKAGANFADLGTDEQREKLKEFGHSWGEMDAAAEGFKTRLATELAPALKPVIDMARDWIMANRDWIATAIADKVRGLAMALSQIDFKSIIDETGEWLRSIYNVIQRFGGLYTILGAVALMLGSPLLGAVGSAITIFGTLGRIITSLGALMWANPILAAIGLVAAGAYLLYENWDWVKTKVGAVFNWFSQQNGWVKALLTTIAPFIFVPMTIYENWEPIRAFFTSLWDDIVGAFNAAWSKISPIVDRIRDAVSWVQKSWIGQHLGGGPDPAALAATANAGRAAVPHDNNPYGMPRFGDGAGGERPNPWTNAAARAAVPHGSAPSGTPRSSDDAGGERPNSWTNTTGPAPQGLYRPDGPAAQNLRLNGKVQVQIAMTGASPGTKVSSSASGIAQPPDTNVGYSNPMAYNY